MALKVADNVLVILENPINRKEKRKAQKEYEKISHHVMPVVLAYLQEENKTDDLRKFAKDEYIKRCKPANTGNVFVMADPHFFDKHFPTKEQIDKIIKPRPMARISAFIIAGMLLLLVTLILLKI